MRKIGLFVLILLGISCAVRAQSGVLQFEKGSLVEMLKRAEREKKMVLMYCHSQWCDACRLMEKQVLPNAGVVSYYNSNFVLMSVDMNVGEGKSLIQKYGVTTFPTFLFLNTRGEVIHRVVGFHAVSDFIRAGEVAKEGRFSFSAMNKRYETGDRDMVFLKDYLIALRKAGDSRLQEIAKVYVATSGLKERFEQGERDVHFMEQYAEVLDVADLHDELNEFVPVYLNCLSIHELTTERNWKWLSFFRDLSLPIRCVIEHQMCYDDVAGGRDQVCVFVARTLQNETFKFMQLLYQADASKLDTLKCDSLILYLRGIVSNATPECLTKLIALRCWKSKDYRGMLTCLQKAEEYGMIDVCSTNWDYMVFFEKLRGCVDSDVLTESVQWLTPLVDRIQDKETKEKLVVLLSDLSYKMGNEK